MAMDHPGHPNGNYEMANLVEASIRLVPSPGSRATTQAPVTSASLAGSGATTSLSETEVRLSYDWSAVPEVVHHTGPQFPPFSPDHLDNSLTQLADLVVG
jgi:hypothetical protein